MTITKATFGKDLMPFEFGELTVHPKTAPGGLVFTINRDHVHVGTVHAMASGPNGMELEVVRPFNKLPVMAHISTYLEEYYK